jgi:hypothetical protein
MLDVEGQVDRFYKKLSARQTYVEQQKTREESLNSPDRSMWTILALDSSCNRRTQARWCS